MKLLNIILKICGKNGGNFLGKIAFDWNPNILNILKLIVLLLQLLQQMEKQ